MLKTIRIKNFAIIEDLELELSHGLNIFTGETGAGKSIVIDAMNFLLGERMGSSVIRTGSNFASVQGIFEKEDEEILFSRELNISGRNLCKLNDELVTLVRLKEAGEDLVDIHGQHEHQSLLKVSRHLELLDAFGGGDSDKLKKVVSSLSRDLDAREKELEELAAEQRERARKIDWLTFVIEEIENARLRDGEEEDLVREREVLVNIERIMEAASQVRNILSGDRENGVIDSLGRVVHLMENISSWDPSIKTISQNVAEAFIIVEEVNRNLANYIEALDFSPERLDDINARLHTIHQMKNKYGSRIEDIERYRCESKRKLEILIGGEERKVALGEEIEILRKRLKEEAEKLSILRHHLAQELQSSIERELESLQMPGVSFMIRIRRMEKICSSGFDDIEFLISPNQGEPLKPLSRIASGGEVSRIMLALKAVFSRVDRIPTLIFDEIDAGLGGRAAESVAMKLKKISKHCQVICVTHLPVIAVQADNHYHIRKEVIRGRTYTRAERIGGKKRIEEIARMMAGKEITDIARKHARALLEKAI